MTTVSYRPKLDPRPNVFGPLHSRRAITAEAKPFSKQLLRELRYDCLALGLCLLCLTIVSGGRLLPHELPMNSPPLDATTSSRDDIRMTVDRRTELLNSPQQAELAPRTLAGPTWVSACDASRLERSTANE